MGSFWENIFPLFENIWGLKHFSCGLGKEYFQLVISEGGKLKHFIKTEHGMGTMCFVILTCDFKVHAFFTNFN